MAFAFRTEHQSMNVPQHRVRVTSEGLIEALGSDAAERLRARAGTFDLLAGPNDVVVLRRSRQLDDLELDGARACMLFGEIRAGEFYEVLQFVGQARWCGELVVQTRGRRSLFFDRGNVVAAESTEEEESIGEVFCRAGVLTRTQVEECTRMRGDGPLRFGEVAVALGFMTEEQLFLEMVRQLKDVFSAVARLESGTFYFFAGFDETRLSFRTQEPVEKLLLDTIRRADETNYFRMRMPSPQHVPRRVEGRTPPQDQADIYAAIDGLRSVEDLCRAASTPDVDVTRALFELVQTGHVTVAPPRFDAADVVAVYNKAISFLLVELDAMDAGDTVRTKLSRFAADTQYSAFFEGAGPADDGTLDGSRIAANLAAAGGGPDAEQRLARRLYDYASYALFLARPHFDRRDARLATEEDARLSSKVVAMLEPLAPPGVTTLGPPPTKAAPVAKSIGIAPTRKSHRYESMAFPGVDISQTARIPAYGKQNDEAAESGTSPSTPRTGGHLRVAARGANRDPSGVGTSPAHSTARLPKALSRGIPRASFPDVDSGAPGSGGTTKGSGNDGSIDATRLGSSEFKAALPLSSPELPRQGSAPELAAAPAFAPQRPGSSPELSARRPGSAPDFAVQRPGSSPDFAVQRPGSSPDVAVQRPGSSPEFRVQRPGSSPEFAVSRQGSAPEFRVQRPGSAPEFSVRPGSSPEHRVQRPGSSPDYGRPPSSHDLASDAMAAAFRRPAVRHAALGLACVLVVALIAAVIVTRRSSSDVASGKSALVVVCDPACEGIYVDGTKQNAISGRAFDVTPGDHDVVVSNRGRSTQHKHVTVGAGSQALVFELPPSRE